MEKLENINIAKMKADIKIKVEEQKFLKNQRKTEKLVGERKMPAWEATYKHQCNREDLRILYAAYGLARGKSFSVTENKYSEENHPLNELTGSIERILKQYEIPIEVEI